MNTYTVAELSQLVGAVYKGDGEAAVFSSSTLQSARSGQICCLANPFFGKLLRLTQASTVITSSKVDKQYGNAFGGNRIIVSDPVAAFTKIVELLEQCFLEPEPFSDIHESVYLGQNVVIGNNCKIGKNSKIMANVVLHDNTVIGNNVIINAGAVLGSRAYNPIKETGRWMMGSQFGGVIIEDNVEIGANTTIDRGAIENTYISTGVKIDNLVQIGHDVIIKPHTTIAGYSAVGSYTTIGEHCIIGGGVGIGANLTITDDVVINGMSAVSKSIRHPDVYSSILTVQRNHEWRRNVARVRSLDKLIKKIKSYMDD